MTSYLYCPAVTVPAATPIAAPVTVPLVLEDRQLDTLRVVIPPGHAGLTGLMITSGGTQIVPYATASWLSGDGEVIDFSWSGEVTQNGLFAVAYNLDVFQHSFILRIAMSDLAAPSPVVIESPQAAAAPSAGTAAIVAGLTGTADLTAALTPADLAALAVPDLTGIGAS